MSRSRKSAMSDQEEMDWSTPGIISVEPLLFNVFTGYLDKCAKLIELLLKFEDDTKGMKMIVSDDDRRKLQGTLDNLCK